MSHTESKISIYKESKVVFKCKAIYGTYFNFIIGSESSNACVIKAPHISRQHAQFIFSKEGFFIQDLNSANGTFINGELINPNEPRKINLNDRIQLSTLDNVLLSINEVKQNEFDLSTYDIQHLLKSKRSLTIGRNESCDIVIPHSSVSRLHAEIFVKNKDKQLDQEYVLVDHKSLNGTYVNGKKVLGKYPITKTDNIFIGNHRLNLAQGIDNLEDELSIFTSGIEKRYDDGFVGLKKTDLAIPTKKLVAIMGPSGCGKSTLLKAINGDSPATNGKVYLFDLELNENFSFLKNKIGYVPQDDIVHKELTVRQCLYYSAKLRLENYSDSRINTKIEEVLDELNIDSKIRDNKVSNLSGGQRKRVAIAIELLTDPLLLFLDEPTSPLDPYVIEEFLSILKDLAQKGTTVVMVTHKPEDLKYMDEVIFMSKNGELAYHGVVKGFKSFFEINKTIDVYEILEDSSRARKFVERMRSRSITQRQSSNESKIINKSDFSFIYQFIWLSNRYLKVKTQDRTNFILMLVQAPIIAALVCSIFSEITGSVLFITCIAAIWFGTNNAAKEIVSEKAIYKRERMFNMSIFPYVFSKITILSIFSCIQSLVYVFMLCIWFNVFKDDNLTLNSPFICFFWMSIVSLVSTTFGLLISSYSKSSEQVMTIVPVVLIPQIMLAGLLAEIQNPFTEVISYLTISRWGNEGFHLIQEKISSLTSFPPSDAGEYLMNQFHDLYQDIPGHGTFTLDIIVLMIMFFVFVTAICFKLKSIDPLKI